VSDLSKGVGSLAEKSAMDVFKAGESDSRVGSTIIRNYRPLSLRSAMSRKETLKM
jgi:hypothetical protein